MSSPGTPIVRERWRFLSVFAGLQRRAKTLGFVALVVLDGALAVFLAPLVGTSCNALPAVSGCHSPLAFTLGIVGVVAAIALIDLGILLLVTAARWYSHRSDQA